MSITTEQRNAIIKLAAVNMLDDNMLDTILGASPKADVSIIADATIAATPRKPKAPKAAPKAETRTQNVAPKATRKPKADKPQTATSKLSPNWNGKLMKADAATITPGQIDNIVGIGQRFEEPFSASEIKDIKAYSMVAASNFYRDLQVTYGVAK